MHVSPATNCNRRHARGIGATFAALLLAELAQAAPAITWPEASYNPQPAPGDVLVPLPCNGAMAFRVIAVGPEPRRLADGADFSRLDGPLPLGIGGQGAYLLGKYEVSRLQAAALRAYASGGAESKAPGDIPPNDGLYLPPDACPTAAGPLGAITDQRERGAARAQRLPQANIAWADARALADDLGAWLGRNADQVPTCGIDYAGACLPRIGDQPASVRLPTEAEWEYAARGGQAVNQARFQAPGAPFSDGLIRHAWIKGNASADPEPIGTRAAGPLGLHDLYGNVSEWQQPSGLDTRAPVGRVAPVRGGSYYSEANELRPGYRAEVPLYDDRGRVHTSDTGLRLLIGAEPAQVSAAGATSRASPASRMPLYAPSWLALVLAAVIVAYGLRLLWQRRPRRRQDLAETAKATEAKAARRPVEKQQPRQLAQLKAFEPEMIALPGGSFQMGSPEDEPERQADEGPHHRVTVRPFAIGKFAVTFAQYDAYAEATGQPKPADQGWGRGERPVINVSWEDAQGYLRWLSQQTGKRYRLPSEAEWEYAARGGTETPFWTGNCIHTDQVNYNGQNDYNKCGAKTGVFRGKTVPVGSLPANAFGLHAVAGNVYEWVQDWYADSYQDAPTDGSAFETLDRDRRVLRGGSWLNFPGWQRSAYRGRGAPDYRNNYVGFRAAQDL